MWREHDEIPSAILIFEMIMRSFDNERQ